MIRNWRFAGMVAALVGLGYTKPVAAEGTVWSQLASVDAGWPARRGQGLSVSVSNDFVLVANIATRRVQPWQRTGMSTWSARELITPPSTYDFGASVSVAGDTAVVGAPLGNSNPVGPGVAYVFVYDGHTWLQQGDPLQANDGAVGDGFGASVAISGDTIVVGAPSKTIGSNVYQGAAYMFVRSAGLWQAQGSALVASDGDALDVFGSAVAIFNDTVVVGASGSDAGRGSVAAGRAYVYSRTGTTWSQQGATLVSPGGSASTHFGVAVSAAADRVLIGADGAPGQEGSAYLFSRDGSDWASHWLALEHEDTPVRGGSFGNAVALRGDLALVNAYVFAHVASAWPQQGPRLFLNGSDDSFLGGVALSDDVAVLGSVNHPVQEPETIGVPLPHGSAYIFAPNADATYCEHDSDCPDQLYCAVIGVCEPRLVPGWKCNACMERDCRACAINGCVDGVCSRKDDGASCKEYDECTSNSCIDGVCASDGDSGEAGAPGAAGAPAAFDAAGAAGADSSVGGVSSGGDGPAGRGSAESGSAGTCAECDAPEPIPSSESSTSCGCTLPRRSSSTAPLLLSLLGVGWALQRRRSTKNV